jgi:dipeptidyl aminopeptidase/acylaminoacyl peptidase
LQITKKTPPTFIIAAKDDDVVSVNHSIIFYNALLAKNIPAEIHTFEVGGHGFGMKKRGLAIDNWPDLLREWLKKNNFIE